MKRQLDEVKRLQKIAGILKENVNEAPQQGGEMDVQAMKAWLENKYGPFVDLTPEDKEAIDYAGLGGEGNIIFKLAKPKEGPNWSDKGEASTKISYIHLLPPDEDYEEATYYEVRESKDCPGDFEEGEGGYGQPTGIWNGTEFEPY